MRGILLSMGIGLGLTLLTELSLALLLKIRGKKDLAVIALVNLLTNPVVNYCYYWAIYLFGRHSGYTVLILALLELAAVLTEFLLYRPLLSFQRFGKLRLSLLLNGASFAAGLIVSMIMQAATS